MTEPDEAARLRAEVARLREQVEAGQQRTGWWRPIVAGLLLTVVALLAPVSVLAT